MHINKSIKTYPQVHTFTLFNRTIAVQIHTPRYSPVARRQSKEMV